MAPFVAIAMFAVAGAPTTAIGTVDHPAPIYALKGGLGPVCFPGRTMFFD